GGQRSCCGSEVHRGSHRSPSGSASTHRGTDNCPEAGHRGLASLEERGRGATRTSPRYCLPARSALVGCGCSKHTGVLPRATDGRRVGGCCSTAGSCRSESSGGV